MEKRISTGTRQHEGEVSQCVHCTVLGRDEAVKSAIRCQSCRHRGDIVPRRQGR